MLLPACLLLTTVESFAYYTLSNVLTLHLSATFDMSDTLAGMHFGLRGTATMVYSTLGGPLIDALGPHRTLPIAFALAAIGRVVFGLAGTANIALVAMYLPMAAGHGLTNAAIAICVKRATSLPAGPAPAWGFALQYCALVLGIMVCGPVIDVATSLFAPAMPYRKLALLCGACSLVGLVISFALLSLPPEVWRTGTCVASSSSSSSSSSSFVGAGVGGGGSGSGSLTQQWLRKLRSVICTARFARYAAFSIAILPGCAVLRNLDGGIFPKFMVRTFGPSVPKGTIYALNPLVDLLSIPLLTAPLRTARHFGLIRLGLSVASLSPLLLLIAPPSIPLVSTTGCPTSSLSCALSSPLPSSALPSSSPRLLSPLVHHSCVRTPGPLRSCASSSFSL